MRPYRLRYHLGRGINFMHWQIRNKDLKSVEHYDPNTFVYTCKNAKLNNSSNAAIKIHSGGNKSVCSWVSFSSGSKELNNFNELEHIEVSYNPRVRPYWTLSVGVADHDLDGFEGDVTVIGKRIFVNKIQLEEFLRKKINGS